MDTNADSQLFSTLCEIDEHNYLYLFERCKDCNVNARQLRYLEKDHIRDLIPKTQLGILAEFEYLLRQWKIAKGYTFATASKSAINLANVDETANNSKVIDKPQMFSKCSQTDNNGTKILQGWSYSPASPKHEDNELLAVLSCNEDTRNLNVESPLNTLDVNKVDETHMENLVSLPRNLNVESPLNTLDINKVDETLMENLVSLPRNLNVESPLNTLDVNEVDETHMENLTLENIIPEVLSKCQGNYRTKKLLSEGDRRLLASSIVDYFQSRKIKLRLNLMDYLAEQISKNFPTEDKKAWCNRQGTGGRGRLYLRFHNSYRSSESRHSCRKRKLLNQLAETSSSTANGKAVACNSTPLNEIEEISNDEEGQRIQDWLKSYKCENFTEVIDMWECTMEYRFVQLKYVKDLEKVREFLDNWPSYKLERGHELLNIDFQYSYPQAMKSFHTRWLVYKQKIEVLLEVDLKDNNCLKLLATYQLQKDYINEDSSSCVLIYMLHAITKPFRLFKTAHGNVRYTISDSQNSMMRLISHKSQMDIYTESYPCIFVLGNSFLEVQECYVVFMDVHYKLNFENCLVVCVQIFTLLKVDEPQASQYFWQFIRGYLFDIRKDNEKAYSIMENMVRYLETAATCT